MKIIGLVCLLACGLALASGKGESGGGGGAAADIVKIDSIVLNLAEGRLIRISPHIKLLDPKDSEYVKASLPLIRFELIKSLIFKDARVVESVKFIQEFSDQSVELLNKKMHGEYIKELFVDEWLIQ